MGHGRQHRLLHPGFLAHTVEKVQAQAFVDVFAAKPIALARAWHGDVHIGDVIVMLERFVDHDRAQRTYAEYAAVHRIALDPTKRLMSTL
jgi:hypothetical protein